MAEKIIDFVSGIEITATPEEIDSVQVFSRQLVDDYGYPKKHIQTRPQYRVKVRPSDTRKEYPVDIAVFSSPMKADKDVSIIVECKKRNRKDGRTQLENYLTLSAASCGVWFNGSERLFIRKVNHPNGDVTFAEIPNIPRFNERLEDIGRFKRKDLKATLSLKTIFKSIRNYLAANAIGATTDDVLAQQLINIIFCKIYDERFTDPDDVVAFHVGIEESPDVVKNRICRIFDNVKKKYREVIENSDSISLDATSVSYVVGELQNYCLMDMERDVIADAFEIFFGKALKGDKGQFFTPRNVARMIVSILDPSDDEVFLDSACGSGGFLIEALRYVWRKIDSEGKKLKWRASAILEEQKEYATSKIRGLDKDEFLVKLTKAYMALLKDGKSGVFCEDSLGLPETWQAKTKVKIALGCANVIATNPPFGSDINVEGEEKLGQYELGYKWDTKKYEKTSKLKKKENPQILFLERNLQLLQDGGRLGIILPETYLHAPSVKYVLKYIESQHNIYAVVDLPHNTFRPNCNAKCIVVFIEKGRPQQDKIAMGIVQEMGHNHQGKPIFRIDPKTKRITTEIWDDTDIVASEFKDPSCRKNSLVFTVSKSDIVNSIYVPRYYWKKNIETLDREAADINCSLVSVQQLIAENVFSVFKGHGAPKSEYKGLGDVFYVRAGDIMDWDIYKNPTSAIPEEVYLEGVKGKIVLKAEDILFVKEGSYRVGDVALLSGYDTHIFLNHHTLVFRINDTKNKYGIDAYYLLYLFSHSLTKRQFFNKILIDTTLPNIGDRWRELRLPLLNDSVKREKIKEQLRAVFREKWEIQKRIESLKDSLK